MTWQTFIRSGVPLLPPSWRNYKTKSLCACVARVLSITITFRQSEAFRRGSPKWPFFRFILALSDCLGLHTALPVINAIASNAAVTHKQASHAQWALQIWTWLQVSGF